MQLCRMKSFCIQRKRPTTLIKIYLTTEDPMRNWPGTGNAVRKPLAAADVAAISFALLSPASGLRAGRQRRESRPVRCCARREPLA